MHKLLMRLLKRHLPPEVDRNCLGGLLPAISDALIQQDNEHALLERSLKLTSDELNEINQELRDRLEQSKIHAQKLEEFTSQQNALLDASPEAILSFFPGGKLNQINQAGCRLMGKPKQELLKNTRKENIEFILKLLKNGERLTQDLKNIAEDKTVTLHGIFETFDGRHYEYHSIPELHNGKYLGRVWCYREFTELKQQQEQLERQAFYDTLTGLPNRLLLLESLNHALATGKRKQTKTAVIFVDLDDFKKINDTAGHEQGDNYLIETCKRLSSSLRGGDTLGRLGGDEFMIILENIEHQQDAILCVERILKNVELPYDINTNQYIISCSLGISMAPGDGDKADELIRKADMAMYQAKKSGKNTFRFFDKSLERIALHRVQTEQSLRNAIYDNQLRLHYQPKICLLTGNLLGVEALLRWQPPGAKLIYPDHFIPIAETTKLINEITRWVVVEACTKLQQWRNTTLKSLSISVNISALDFSDPGFLPFVLTALAAYGITPDTLEFELTESAFFESRASTYEVLTTLKQHGIRLSIDDFGTGYSSFSYLQEMNVDSLKIDRSFITNIHQNLRNQAIVKSIITIGTNLQQIVVAEGIESEQELTYLRSIGCHVGQGYHFSKPLDEAFLLSYADSQPIGA